MHLRARDGFTTLELVIGLAVLAVLAGITTVGYASSVERAARAPLLEDLDRVVEMEQALRARGGEFVPIAQLRSLGWESSADVVVEESRVSRDRVYVRVRHARSQRRCSVDYSPTSARAINRKACFRGLDDPDAEPPIPDDAPEAPEPPIVAVAEPQVIPPEPPAMIRAPWVSDPADRIGNPGESRTEWFTVTNRSAGSRVYALEASFSNPSVVEFSDAPESLALEEGESATVPVSYAIPSSAVADAASRVALRATDRAAPAYAGDGSFGVTTAAVPQAPRVRFPGGQTVQPGAAASNVATIDNPGNVAVHACMATRAEAGTVAAAEVVTGTEVVAPSAPHCLMVPAFGSAAATVSYHVAEGARMGWTNRVVLGAWDRERPALAGETEFTVTAGLQLRTPGIQGPGDESWAEGQRKALAFRITNTSNAERTLCIRITSGDASRIGLVGGGEDREECAWRLGPGASADHSRWFEARAPTGAVELTATVYDAEDPEYRASWTFRNRVAALPRLPTAGFVVRSVDEPEVAVHWTRKWHAFDATPSTSPAAGGDIVKWEWSWGRMGWVWSDALRRFVPGADGWDVQASPRVDRAYDEPGEWQVCLRVTNRAGGSDEECKAVRFQRETRARLSWTFDSWWTDHSTGGLGGIGAGNGHDDHGTHRMMFYPQASLGDVPIKRAWITLTTRFWSWTGGAEDVTTYSETDQPYNAAGTYSRAPGSLCPAPRESYLALRGDDERWCWEHLFRLEGVESDGTLPTLFQTDHYNRRGIFGQDVSRSHRVSSVTLFVTDARDRTTRFSATFATEKDPWNREPITYPLQEPAPEASFQREERPDGEWLFADVVASSRDGRIVNTWIEVEQPDLMDGTTPPRVRVPGTSWRGRPPRCGTLYVHAMARDDLGQIGENARPVSSGMPCAPPPRTPGGRT